MSLSPDVAVHLSQALLHEIAALAKEDHTLQCATAEQPERSTEFAMQRQRNDARRAFLDRAVVEVAASIKEG